MVWFVSNLILTQNKVVGIVDLQEYKGSHGKDVLEQEKYVPLQKKYTLGDSRIQLLHCPTCTELCHGVRFKDFVDNAKMRTFYFIFLITFLIHVFVLHSKYINALSLCNF